MSSPWLSVPSDLFLCDMSDELQPISTSSILVGFSRVAASSIFTSAVCFVFQAGLEAVDLYRRAAVGVRIGVREGDRGTARVDGEWAQEAVLATKALYEAIVGGVGVERLWEEPAEIYCFQWLYQYI